MLKRFFAVLGLLIAPAFASAQEVIVEQRPAVVAETAAPDAALSLRFPLYSFTQSVRDVPFISNVTLSRPPPPGSMTIKYGGLHGLVVRRVQGRLKREWRDSIQDAWENGLLDDQEYRSKITDMQNELTDFEVGGRWWERRWWDSLPPERGGAPADPLVVQIGDAHEVCRLGPFRLTNEFRVRVDDIGAFRMRGSIESDATDALASGKLRDVLPSDFDASPVSWGLITDLRKLGSSCKIRVRPSVGVRILAPPAEMIRNVTVRIDGEIRYGSGRSFPLKFSVVMSYEPARNNASVIFGLSL